MSSVYPLILRYGAGFAFSLDLNAGANGTSGDYVCLHNGLADGPEMPVLLADNIYDAPTVIRAKLKERVFSITVRVGPYVDVDGSAYNAALDNLKLGAFNGPLQVVVQRTGVGNLYINCRCDKMTERDRGDFQLEFTAADPVYTLDTAPNFAAVDQPGSGAYLDLALGTYPGTAPSQPILTLAMNSTSQFWHYYQEVVVTNPAAYTRNYCPVCITIDAASLVAAGKLRSDFGDFRLISPGGAHKDIFIRNTSNPSALKIWFILYKLDPGETKTLRLLYGASGQTLEPEPTYVRHQFNGNASTNLHWDYWDCMPLPALAQSRAQQWHHHGFGSSNLAPIDYRHPDFTASGDPAVVPAFGGHATFHGPASGYAGVQFSGEIDITQIDFDYRMRSNGKDPFVVRTQQIGNAWQDVYVSSLDGAVGSLDTAQRTTLTQACLSSNHLYVVSNAGLVVGDTISIKMSDGSWQAKVIGSFVGTTEIFLTTSLTLTAYYGAEVTKYPTGYYVATQSLTFASGSRPQTVAMAMRGDHPELTTGEWYYAAAETVILYFDSTQVPTITLGPETSIPCNIIGTLSNSATGESISLSTITSPGDVLTLDCVARTCMLNHAVDTTLTANAAIGATTLTVASTTPFTVGHTLTVLLNNGTEFTANLLSVNGITHVLTIDVPLPSAANSGKSVWDTGHIINRFDCLTFPTISRYWVHLEPGLSQNIVFSGLNMYNLHVTITWPVRYY